MNLTRCSQGHFYDADTNATCPHCQGGKGNDETMILQRKVEDDSKTIPLTEAIKPQQEAAKTVSKTNMGVTMGSGVSMVQDDNEKTISFAKEKVGREPVVGWLVCVDGPHKGSDFRLKTGKNFIGRGSNMDAALTEDKSVSRDKHAIVLYEPRKHTFLVQPGESRELCYLNEEVVLSAQMLKRNDVITVGDSKLMFFPCCDSIFNWDMADKAEETKADSKE